MRFKCDQSWVLRPAGKQQESHRCNRLRWHIRSHRCHCGKRLDREFEQFRNENGVVVIEFIK